MNKKALMALFLATVMVLGCCGCSGEKEEAYRMIQVLEVSGSVSVERASMGAMDAYEGMRLESGDKITVGTDSWLKIKMDEDKYAMVEPDSVLRLEASGSSADSKTVLHLETGSVSNRLEEKLSEASSYEVNTPNATMAVRGTVFQVEVRSDEDGASISDVRVYGGSVASRLIHPDGTMDSEQAAVLIENGKTAQVWGNSILSRYVTKDAKLDLNDLGLKTLKFLQEAQEAGQKLSITPEMLKERIAALEQEPASTEETSEPTEETTVPTEETTVPTTAPTTPRPTTPPATNPPAPVEPAPPAATETPTEAPTLPTYTVTFQYNGGTFATQTVTSGETATAPKLQPTPSGSWTGIDTPITGNTTISWRAD